jgi:hypothetical protein
MEGIKSVIEGMAWIRIDYGTVFNKSRAYGWKSCMLTV